MAVHTAPGADNTTGPKRRRYPILDDRTAPSAARNKLARQLFAREVVHN